MIPRVSAAAAAAQRAAAALPLGRHRITPRLATRLLSPLLVPSAGPAPAPAPATHRSTSTSASPSRTRDIVAQAVASIGSRREGQQYLKYFTSVSSQRFAVIKVGGAILTDHLDELCRSVAFLYELGLYPVLVHGGGPQLNRLLEAAGVEPQFEEGIRVTDAATLRVAYDLFARENGRLVARLDELGVMTRPLLYGVLEAEYLDRDRWGYVGRVTRVRRESVEGAIDAGYVPILASLAATADGQLLNINADVAAAELARALEPLKVVYLSERGGLFNDETGRIISRIELDEEYDHLMRQPWCRYGTRLKLREIKDLLDTLPRSSSVAIIHPSQIQRELFTDSGAGTMILRGDRVKVANSLDGFSDLARLREALRRDHPSVEAPAEADGPEEEARIDRCLRKLATEPFRAYFDESLHCLGIVTPPPQHPAADRTGIATLTTLAVTRHGWISNAAENVFAAIRKDFPRLVFSVGADDENLPWFFSRSSGSLAGPSRRRVFFWWGAGHTDPDLLAAWETFVKEEEREASPSSSEGSGQQAPARPPPPPARPSLQQQPPPQQQQARTFSTTSARSRPQSPIADISDHSRCYSAKLRSPNPNPPLDKSNATNSRPSRVALLGARGYTGRALIDLINTHPHFNLTHVSSRELAGQPLDCYTRHELTYVNLRTDDVTRMERQGVIDCWVLALPNGVCGAYVAALEEARAAMPPSARPSVVVDLSADYRFDSGWTYGLPELTPRPAIAASRFISNPGCYATAAQLGIAPLVAFLGGEPTVFGVSGYSGAGTKPSAKNDVELLRDNLIPYSLADHVHEREMSRHLGASVAFCPHVASWFRGIHNTISIPLCQPMTSRDIRQMYQDRYAGERLVKVVGEAPLVKAIMGRHGVEIGGFAVHSSGKRVIVCTTIDNLFKGAATQCLQNMNLALGYAEYEGIPTM